MEVEPEQKKKGKAGVDSAYAVTGMTSSSIEAETRVVTQAQIDNVLNGTALNANDLYLWNQVQGQNASTTGTIYGIYDLSGGINERTSSFVSSENASLWRYGQAVIDSAENGAQIEANTGASSKYATAYNSNIYGDAIKETTDLTAGNNNSGWNNDYSILPEGGRVFFNRGGGWASALNAGIFAFDNNDGSNYCFGGFRSVLVSN